MQITRQISTKHTALKSTIETELVFDFEDVTQAELAELATKSSSMIVDYQAKARSCKKLDEFKKFSGRQVIKVRDLIDNRRTRRTAEEKEADMLAQADPAKLLAELKRRGVIEE